MLHVSSTVLFTGWLLLKRKRFAWRSAQGKFKILKGVIWVPLSPQPNQHLLWATEFSVIVMKMSVSWKRPFGHNFSIGGILNMDCKAVEVRAFKERNVRLQRSRVLPLLFDTKWFQIVSRGIYSCNVYTRYKTIHIWCSIMYKVSKKVTNLWLSIH